VAYSALTTAEIAVGKPITNSLMTKIKDDFDFIYPLVPTINESVLHNGSFEIDADASGVPDNWTQHLYTNGAGAFDTTTPEHGAKAYKFTRTAGAGNGGGDLESDYVMVNPLTTPIVIFSHMATAAGMKNIVKVRYFTAAKAYISDQDIYSSTANPTSWTRFILACIIPATARFATVRVIGGWTDPDVAGVAYFDDVQMWSLSVTQSMLKTSTGEVTGSGRKTLPGGEYGFHPQLKNCDAGQVVAFALNDPGATYVTNIESAGTFTAQQRYVTASGSEYWVFLLRNNLTGKITDGYAAPDHPCHGNGNDPAIVPHPFSQYWEDGPPANIQIVLVDMAGIEAVMKRQEENKTKMVTVKRLSKIYEIPVERSILEIIMEDFDIDDKEKEFVPRDMNGKQMLSVQDESYVVKGLKLKEAK
jgi:hypothetical protein